MAAEAEAGVCQIISSDFYIYLIKYIYIYTVYRKISFRMSMKELLSINRLYNAFIDENELRYFNLSSSSFLKAFFAFYIVYRCLAVKRIKNEFTNGIQRKGTHHNLSGMVLWTLFI